MIADPACSLAELAGLLFAGFHEKHVEINFHTMGNTVKKLFWFATACCVLFTSTAQAQYASNRSVISRLDSLERNIQLLQKQTANGIVAEGIDPSDAAGANILSQIAQVQEELSKLRGEIEQVQFQNRQLKEQLERNVKDIDFRLQQLERRPVADNAPPVDAQEPAHPDAHANDGEEEPREDGRPKPLKPQPAHSDDDSTPSFATSREHYNYAFRLLNQAKYAEAGKSFEGFVAKYPKDPLTGNAFYWLGETNYVRKDYVKAADSFRQGFEVQPSGPKAADNLLKLGMSLNSLKRTKESCVVLKQLVAKFGATSESIKQKAEQEIEQNGCQ